ncbi:hypothetical protein BDZ45DRAFT_735804 [Acephala macrosclerotiorum]|nr:hypothetical protein BDZ45DRAFT_735804 [Acephala macrosclerotiorum]
MVFVAMKCRDVASSIDNNLHLSSTTILQSRAEFPGIFGDSAQFGTMETEHDLVEEIRAAHTAKASRTQGMPSQEEHEEEEESPQRSQEQSLRRSEHSRQGSQISIESQRIIRRPAGSQEMKHNN